MSASNLRWLSATLLAALLTGCGSKQLNSAGAEATIRTLVVSKLGVPVRRVTCPQNVGLQAGRVTVCQVTMQSGEVEPFSVRQKDAKGNVHIQPTEMIAGGVEKTISERLAAKGFTVTASCPQHVPIRVGTRFACSATNGRSSLPITVTIVDSSGAYRLRSGQPRPA